MKLFSRLAIALTLCLGTLSVPGALAGDEPVTFDLSVDPATVTAGGEAKLSLQLRIADGVKLNMYPKVQLKVPALEGLVQEAHASMGRDKPPSVEELEAGQNYFKQVGPLELTLQIDETASAGRHEVDGKLRVNYCILASGLCKPARIPIKIPLDVR